MINMLLVNEATLSTTKLDTLNNMHVVIVQQHDGWFWYHKDKVNNTRSCKLFDPNQISEHMNRLVNS